MQFARQGAALVLLHGDQATGDREQLAVLLLQARVEAVAVGEVVDQQYPEAAPVEAELVHADDRAERLVTAIATTPQLHAAGQRQRAGERGIGDRGIGEQLRRRSRRPVAGVEPQLLHGDRVGGDDAAVAQHQRADRQRPGEREQLLFALGARIVARIVAVADAIAGPGWVSWQTGGQTRRRVSRRLSQYGGARAQQRGQRRAAGQRRQREPQRLRGARPEQRLQPAHQHRRGQGLPGQRCRDRDGRQRSKAKPGPRCVARPGELGRHRGTVPRRP